MRIESCEFPDELLYEPDGLVWLRPEASGEVVLGITSLHAAVAGRLTRVEARPVGKEYGRGKSVGTLESGRYFGPIRTPVRGLLVAVNPDAVRTPKTMSERPYAEGWFARLRPLAWEEDCGVLKSAGEAKELLAAQMTSLHVHCFAAFPDYELFEIGTECSAVLTKLDDTLSRAADGEVVHLVSDDWTAPAEMVNWSQRTGYPVIEERTEGNLYHFLVRKRTWD
ncbi:MAG TPA: sulfurtransferase TusA family protein [Thermoplasmata archaeon]|nr:sulfurtransferase TusA family protein [Thermoplasmata archaeon]